MEVMQWLTSRPHPRFPFRWNARIMYIILHV